jgi:hypothetical protein
MILYDSILASGHGIYGVFFRVSFGWEWELPFDFGCDGVCEEGFALCWAILVGFCIATFRPG